MSESVDLSSARVTINDVTDCSVFDVSFDINFTSATSFDISFINQSGVYTPPKLDCENPRTLTIGATKINVYPVSYSIRKNGSEKVMAVTYVDSGVKYLDKFLVSLKDIKNPRVLSLVNVLSPDSGEGSFQTSGYLLSDLLEAIKAARIPISSSAESFLTNSSGFITNQEYQRVFVMMETGRLRDVLSSYASKVGCLFFWNFISEKLDAVSVRREFAKTEAKALASSLLSQLGEKVSEYNESESIQDSNSQSAIVYDTYGGYAQNRTTFYNFSRVKVEEPSIIPWVTKFREVTGQSNGSQLIRPSIYLNNVAKIVTAQRLGSFKEYVYCELLADALKNDRAHKFDDGYKADVLALTTSITPSKVVKYLFPQLTVVDYVNGSLSEHWDEIKLNGNIAQFFSELTGPEVSDTDPNITLFKGAVNESNTNGRKFYICRIDGDFLPESEKMKKCESLADILSKTYNSLFVSTGKFTRSELAKYSMTYGAWHWEKENVDKISPFNTLKNLKLKNATKVAFDPFYSDFAMNNMAQDLNYDKEMEEETGGKSKGLYGRLLIDLNLGEKGLPSSGYEDLILPLEEDTQRAMSFNLGIKDAVGDGDKRTGWLIIFEDTVNNLLGEISAKYDSVVATDDKITKKFIRSEQVPSRLAYEKAISNLSNPSCTSNDIQILKAPLLADLGVNESQANPFVSKVDLRYLVDFLRSQGAFDDQPSSISYSMTVEDLVPLSQDYLKNGLENFSLSIGSGGVTTQLTVSNRKKFYQSADELSRLMTTQRDGFSDVKRQRRSIALFNSRINSELFK